ncbi:hypothetical protein ACIQU4_01760 [Streptomyces sp. NPDC090741]|uniref:hypothetical protein n=1 Tax=Streptomyces sp. NPDC090741 TaxID=3365967 RepID=UPI0037F981D3
MSLPLNLSTVRRAVYAIALAGLFTWAGAPGEFVSPILFGLSGAIAVLLPRARWMA